jgi:limonene-1,2-epoxide hydrolase
MTRTPKQTVERWVEAFNRADADAVVALYAENAVNHQIAYTPMEGRDAIRRLFETEFARAEMRCDIENLFEDGEWAILEWSDPNGLRGCGFFHVQDGLIVFQRGYFDRLTFYKAAGIPLEDIPA